MRITPPTSRKRTRVLLCLLAIITLAGLAWLFLHTREPSYEGKPLSFWLEQAGTVPIFTAPTTQTTPTPMSRFQVARAGLMLPVVRSNVDYVKIEQAFHSMGSNAVPVLVAMADAEDSNLKIRCQRLLEKQSLVKFHFTPPLQRRLEAIHAMSLVGAPAIPELQRRLNDTETGFLAAYALGRIGPQAFEPLCHALTNQYKITRDAAVDSLSFFDPDSQMIASITAMLKNPDAVTRKNAVTILGNWGPSAQSSVPDLLQMKQDEELHVREAVTRALRTIRKPRPKPE